MRDEIKRVSAKINQAAGQRQSLLKQQREYAEKHDIAKEREENSLLAKELVLAVAKQTQMTIGERISDLVSLALASVFDENAYILDIDFVQRRGVTEADIYFCKDGNRLDPFSASGGGALDIASFALRIAVWSLSRTTPIFLLDEPFKHLSIEYQVKAGMLLRELSRKLNFQIIIISHNPEVISGADRIFDVSKCGSKTLITVRE